MYDLVIIGGGIGGMTAAIYGARRALKVLILTADIGGQMSKNPEIENWPGEVKIDGSQLGTKIKDQVEKLGAEIKYELVNKIDKKDKGFVVKTMAGEYETKTIILGFGKTPRRIGVPGEEELTGRGVSYCVTCDGPFFRGKVVSIIGGGNSALDAAHLMSKLAEKVYLIHRKPEFRGDEFLVKKVNDDKNVENIMSANLAKIEGKEKVEKITLDTGRELTVDAVFIEIGYLVNDSLVKGLVDVDEKGQVIIDNNYMTSTPGIFAAGDLTNSPYQQLVIAAGEGATAALSAYHYIDEKY